MKPPTYGYLRLSLCVDMPADLELLAVHAEAKKLAERDEFHAFIEASRHPAPGITELLTHIRRSGGRDLVVPSLAHLGDYTETLRSHVNIWTLDPDCCWPAARPIERPKRKRIMRIGRSL